MLNEIVLISIIIKLVIYFIDVHIPLMRNMLLLLGRCFTNLETLKSIKFALHYDIKTIVLYANAFEHIMISFMLKIHDLDNYF